MASSVVSTITGHAAVSQKKTTERFWWKEASVYQIYPASFYDSNGDGLGDIAGVLHKIDYLKALGVDVVWLCPVYESPQADMGYDISNYRAIHAPYGTLQDVDNLIAALHERGMKLVMDLVVNHTSDQHEWFTESRSSKANSKRDWYIWRKPNYDAAGNRYPPNNWASIFGGPTWTYDEQTGEYYLHLFCKEQPDLNWENPDVVREVHDVMEFWLRRGVDGFRMDVINLVSKTPGLPDAPVSLPGQVCQPAYMHYAFGPRLNEHLRGLRQILDRYDAFAVGEMPWVKDPNKVASAVGAHRKELNMIFQFDIVDMDVGEDTKYSPNHWNLRTLKSIVEKWQTYMYDINGWNALFLENHDQSRSVSRFTTHRQENKHLAAKMLATFIGLQAGTLFVFQGQELGMSNLPKDWSIDEYKDIETQNFYAEAVKRFAKDPVAMQTFMDGIHLKARDNSRSPMQWNTDTNAGFSKASPWMRVNDNYLECNAEQQCADPSSVLSYWQKLLRIRKQYKDIFIYGRFDMIDREDSAVICYKRSSSAGQAHVILNFTDAEQRWTIPPSVAAAWAVGAKMLSNYDDEQVFEGGQVLLKPFEVVVLIEDQGRRRF